MIGLYVHIMGNLSVDDTLLTLRNSSPSEKMYVHRHSDKSVCHPNAVGGPLLPWPVVWLLGAHHRKHIFISGQLPPLGAVRLSVDNFVEELKWQYLFKMGILEASDDVQWVGRRKLAPPCRHEGLPWEVKCWLGNLATHIKAAAARVRKVQHPSRADAGVVILHCIDWPLHYGKKVTT